ncbi:hypothetical protein [Paenibacillus sp. YPG26]|uniref:hypothetical protein n=1 Tax=Paenibacillus sp. YPG26 TaxID=2878915 RepID=UPI00203F9A09|nr:hypothetical protein [Paenibacillus sp. YPG26]USB32947.1 hypothetical protein LDO05_17125 [Paenibacillus sp. YPG26]
MRKAGFAILLLMMLLTMGYSIGAGTPKPHLYRGDEKAAEAYIQSKGYSITGYRGELSTYTLQKSLLREIWCEQIWSVQSEPPENYWGREITTYGFVVENHPLSKKLQLPVEVNMMMTDGRVIGGYSFPHSDEPLVGAVYSLEGKVLEELTGLTFAEWKSRWEEKYGDQTGN